MLPGLVPFALSPIPHRDPLSPLARGIILGVALALTGLVFRMGRSVARAGERDWTARVLSYPAVCFGMILLFPARPEYAAVVVVILAFGDGVATLAGVRWGRTALPWNAAKTWVGSSGFVLVATPLAALAYWLEAQPAVPAGEAAVCALVAVLGAAAAESVRSRWNDNLRAGVAAGVGVIVARLALVGQV